jgi:hypothetical protein
MIHRADWDVLRRVQAVLQETQCQGDLITRSASDSQCDFLYSRVFIDPKKQAKKQESCQQTDVK